MADGGCSLGNPSKRRLQIKPHHDAEKHIRLKTDKAGLREVFVNSYKGQSSSALYSFHSLLILLKYGLQCERWTTGLVDT